jgi:hypothetical protein
MMDNMNAKFGRTWDGIERQATETRGETRWTRGGGAGRKKLPTTFPCILDHILAPYNLYICLSIIKGRPIVVRKPPCFKPHCVIYFFSSIFLLFHGKGNRKSIRFPFVLCIQKNPKVKATLPKVQKSMTQRSKVCELK